MNKQIKSKVIFVIGVSGSGKTSIGQMLAKTINYKFFDADDFHTKSNIEKMSNGIPLTDEDRLPWLNSLNKIAKLNEANGCVITCSALKQNYRNILANALQNNVSWIYLKGSYQLIYERMQKRANHFMDAKMLKSQFDALEEPANAIEIDIAQTPQKIVENIKSILQ